MTSFSVSCSTNTIIFLYLRMKNTTEKWPLIHQYFQAKLQKKNFLADLITYTEEILSGKLHFCSVQIACRCLKVMWDFFFYDGFLSRTFTIHRTAGKGQGISLTPLYRYHPLHRQLDVSRAITTDSPLHIASNLTRTGNLWFPSVCR